MAKNKKNRTKDLYIDIDGVLVSLSENQLPYPKLVPDVMKFLEWANKNFRCHYLTCWPEDEIRKAFPMLPKFHYSKWIRRLSCNNKTTGIDFSNEFIWLEDGATTEELSVLKEKGKIDSYYYIDPEDDYALTKFMEQYKGA